MRNGSAEPARRPLPAYEEAVRRSGVMTLLAAFDPHVVGTLPIGMAVAGSDIDILCHAPDPSAFAAAAWSGLSGQPGFAMHQWSGPERPVVVRFACDGWPFEIFGGAIPVADQPGWRHFVVERRLLAIGGAALRAAVMRKRQAGLKTEPAFAAALGIGPDAYAAILALFRATDRELRDLVTRRRHEGCFDRMC